jgi:predicted nucleic acid-binding protein
MNSQVCVDASLIIRSLVPDSFTDHALELLARWRREQTVIMAPALLSFEVISTLRRYVHFKRIAPSQGERAFEQFQQMHVRLSHRRAIFPLAWQLAKQFHRPTAYDTTYLALAQLTKCDFWTADEKLYNTVKGKLSWIKWVGNAVSPVNGSGRS